MPERRAVTRDDTLGYRVSARPEELAWTTPLEPHERLLRWMVWRRLGREWPIPEEVAVDREHVFVRPAGRKPEEAFLLPLGALRWREDHGVDAVYVFGRHTRLPMLGRRAGCPVRDRLDQALRGT
ncbi:MAG: hypothetical protein R3B99_20540 [Polyangiales bacterium]|nr:hypothetical protein [Myxococcales bacterium]